MNKPPPKDVSVIKSSCGMVTYLAKFLPHLSSICAPLCKLEKKMMLDGTGRNNMKLPWKISKD